MTFLPAAITLCRPPRADTETGFGWAAKLDEAIRRNSRSLLTVFGVLGCLGIALLPRLGFDSNPLHTKDPTTEAMRTLDDLRQSPFANPFTADIIAADAAAAAAISQRLHNLPLVGGVLSINSFVPTDQEEKLALIGDARDLLQVTLEPRPAPARPEPNQIRAAARTALGQIEPALSKATADPVLAALAGDLRRTRYRGRCCIAVGRSIAGAVPADADGSIARRARGRARDLAIDPAGYQARLGPARWTGAPSGIAEAGGAQQQRPRGIRRRNHLGRTRRHRSRADHCRDQRYDRDLVPLRGNWRTGGDHDDPVRCAASRFWTWPWCSRRCCSPF